VYAYTLKPSLAAKPQQILGLLQDCLAPLLPWALLRWPGVPAKGEMQGPRPIASCAHRPHLSLGQPAAPRLGSGRHCCKHCVNIRRLAADCPWCPSTTLQRHHQQGSKDAASEHTRVCRDTPDARRTSHSKHAVAALSLTNGRCDIRQPWLTFYHNLHISCKTSHVS
jgi:hypothetical protein